jgi:hypothetical protein
MASPHTPPRSSSSALGLVAGATVLAALVAFLAGRLTADAAPSQREGRGARSGTATVASAEEASEPARADTARRADSPQATRPTGTSPSASLAEGPALAMASAPPAIPMPGQSSPQVVEATQKAALETHSQLEAAKRDLVERCWPAGGLPGGRTSARVTFSVAYDAYGREVGRAVGDGRRSGTGELRTCLGRLPLGMLRVSPPGSSVSVKVALNLP